MHNLGAWVDKRGVNFRLWAPQCKTIDVMVEGKGTFELKRQKDGFFVGHSRTFGEGDLYKFKVNGESSFPDPCSRFQPEGPHGPSMIVDPHKFRWTDKAWQKIGIELQGQVIYELHVGTFSPSGDYAGVTAQLGELKKLGITVIELMPLAEFPGRWNWGYDGVSLFAPEHVYGSPDDLRRLINEAHHLGIAVILDVVYNHLGPDGNYLKIYSKDYFADQYTTDWGEALNFDGRNSANVRDFFVQNACYWINEFHFDGLRLDATQNIYDESKTHILSEIVSSIRKIAAPKKLIVVGENEPQDVKLMKPIKDGGYGIDSLWNDDFHHSASVALTGKREAYYTDYFGTPQEFISMIKRGFLYQGQYYSWQKQPRGTFVGEEIAAKQFITFLENHDQVANSLDGKRLTERADIGNVQAMTALLLLGPQTPMLFMGQEFGSTSPFLFFTDHNKELGGMVYKGRKEFLTQFPSIRRAQRLIDHPNEEQTFQKSKLNFKERKTNKFIYQLHKDLLKLRREDEIFNRQDKNILDGAVLGEHAFVIRYKGKRSDRLLIINLGNDINLSPCPDPLLAPLPDRSWKCLWSSNNTRYGGHRNGKTFRGDRWHIPGHAAEVFTSGGKND